MQYFSIVARSSNDDPRTCAMFQSSTLESAASQARSVVEADILPHVRPESRLSVRRSSRRETALLQAFLASRIHDHMSIYEPKDVDSLLSRRNSMLLSFFMALYLDPDAMKRRFDAPLPIKPGSSGSGGSGGSATDRSVEQPASIEVGGSPVSDQVPDVQSVDATESSDVVSDENQLDALADIVNGAGDQRDEEIDLY